MRCRICGAKLRKEGDICKSCYEEYCKEEELEKDTNEIFKIYRKYLPKYQLTRYFDWYILFILFMLTLIIQGNPLYVVLLIVVSLIILGVALIISKRIAVNTICTFYDKKVVRQYKKRKKTLAYSDLRNVTYYQNFFQKIFHLGDVQFHPVAGTYLIGGFEVKNVPNIEENWKRIEEIINTKKEV